MPKLSLKLNDKWVAYMRDTRAEYSPGAVPDFVPLFPLPKSEELVGKAVGGPDALPLADFTWVDCQQGLFAGLLVGRVCFTYA